MSEPALPEVPGALRLEPGAVGALAAPWVLVEPEQAVAEVVAGESAAAALQLTVPDDERARVEHALDVARFRGRRVVISARARLAGMGYRAHGTIGLDLRRGDAPRRYEDRPRAPRITPRGWIDSVAIADVPADATGAVLVIEAGGGVLTVEDVTLTDVGVAGRGDEPPRALDGRALENVVAFARLYGLVRYFHPSDEAAALAPEAWERFVRDGITRVEGAPDAPALAAALAELFAPLAPSLHVHLDGAPPATPAAGAAPPGGRPVTWRHVGVGLTQPSLYRSERAGLAASPAFVTITTTLPATALRGARLRVRAAVRGTARAPGFDAGLWLVSESQQASATFYTEPERQPDPTDAWAPIEVEGVVPADASTLRLGVQVIGDGDAAIDRITVERLDGARPAAIAVPTWSRRGALAADWERSVGDRQYTVEPGGAGCDRRATCLAIRRPVPPPQPPWIGRLGGGVSARVPVQVWHDGARTVPAATAAAAPPSTAALVPTDRATRLAAVVIAWNVLQHFFPYFDVTRPDWPAELRTALGRAALDLDAAAFHRTLRRLVGALRDGHGFVSHDAEPADGTTPWSWAFLGADLVVTRVAPACACDLAPGDVVLAIDGVATADAVAAIAPEATMATPQHAAFVRAARLRTGAAGARRTVRVRRGAAEHDVTTTLVRRRDLGTALDDLRPANGTELAPGIRYVDAGNCSADEWQRLLPDLAAARAVLIDMRGYPSDWRASPLGHLTDRPIASPRWHVPEVSRPDREAMTFDASDWKVAPAKPRLRRAVFLTDGRAVSAAETFMGIVEGHRLGEIVGGPTAGTNGNINPFSVPGGYTVTWTGMKVLKDDGRRHHGVGIQPTVPAAPTAAGLAAGRDEVLERALEVARRPPRRR